jgi:hypothetical protein
MTSNLEVYWDETLSALLTQLESTPDVDSGRLATFKMQLNRWRSRAERSKGETFDVASAVGLYQQGRKMLDKAGAKGDTLPPSLQIADVTVQTAGQVAVTTAVSVGAVCLLIGLAIYGLSR